jgi:Ca-activated chloride channel family protein
MQVQTRFTFDKVKYDQENELHLVVSLKAPKTDWQTKRSPVCLTLVCDVSGSMAGAKLDYAKKSICKLIEHLQPGDFVGLVAFSDHVETIFPTQEVTQFKKDELIIKAQQLRDLGSTNLSGGMLQGLEHANKSDIPTNCVNRVILFTDGVANAGVATQASQLLPLLTQNLGKATLSAFGYGSDADQELLSSMAKTGKGNYAFIKNPDDALSAFAKELGGLLSTYAQDIVIEVAPHNGHRVSSVVSDVDVEESGNNVKIKLSDILAEEDRHIVVAMKLSKQAQALPRAMNVADVSVSYTVLENNTKTKKSESLKAKIRFVKDGEEQVKATEEVDKIVGLAEMVRVQVKAENFAKAGDFNNASATLDIAAAGFLSRNLGGHARATKGLRDRMATPTLYASNAGYITSAKNAASRSYGTSGMDHDADAMIQGLTGASSASPAQEMFIQSFAGDGGSWDGGVANVQVPGQGAIGGVPLPGFAPVTPLPPLKEVLEDAKKKIKEEKKPLSKKRSDSRW